MIFETLDSLVHVGFGWKLWLAAVWPVTGWPGVLQMEHLKACRIGVAAPVRLRSSDAALSMACFLRCSSVFTGSFRPWRSRPAVESGGKEGARVS